MSQPRDLAENGRTFKLKNCAAQGEIICLACAVKGITYKASELCGPVVESQRSSEAKEFRFAREGESSIGSLNGLCLPHIAAQLCLSTSTMVSGL